LAVQKANEWLERPVVRTSTGGEMVG